MIEKPTLNPGPTPPALWRRLVSKHPFRRGGLLVLLALVLEYLVLPQIAGVRRSLGLLGRVNIGYVALGTVLEVASLASYAQLTKAVLPARASRFSRIWRIDLSTLAVSHVLPGGTAGGDGLGYRLLTGEGVSGSDAGLALAVQGIGSALVLNAILWLALIVSIPESGFNPIYATAAIVGALLLAAFAGLVLLLTKGEERASVIVGKLVARLPFLKEGAAETAHHVVHQVAKRAAVMAADRALITPSCAMGLGQLAARRRVAVRFPARLRPYRKPRRPARGLRARLRAGRYPRNPGGLGSRGRGARAQPGRLRGHPRCGHRRRDRLPLGQLLAAYPRRSGSLLVAAGRRRSAGGEPEGGAQTCRGRGKVASTANAPLRPGRRALRDTLV